MMPSNFNVSNGQQSYSGLQSANMVSSMQTTSKQSYTSYKVQSNSYTSGGDRVEYDDHSSGTERPGSRLKANIDELDTLLCIQLIRVDGMKNILYYKNTP